ncbi:MAG TPA: leucine-rich repeat domain-containing protein [Bacillales bacterium]|nr:leucine-rich repeat domain-containing protein [Bacillales bacterium]
MKKRRLQVFITILALVLSFGFTTQSPKADTNTDENTTQPTGDTTTTGDSAQTTDKSTDKTQSTDPTQTTEVTTQSADEVVVFKDANLAQAIRSQLQLKQGEDITKTDLAKVNYLFTKDISNLSGLEYAKNLVMLGISDGSISDLIPLKSLTKLQSLNLSGNKITDISVLTQIPNLTVANVADNPLNFNPGSAAYNDLQTLVGNDVRVYHDGMVHFTTKKVTKNAITVGWTIDQSDGMPHLFTLSLNGKPVKTIDLVKKAESEHTFTGLKEGQTYDIELSTYFNLIARDNKVTKTLHVKAEDIQPQPQVTVKPAVGGQLATIGDQNIDAVKTGGTLEIDLKNYTQDQVNVKLTAAQIKNMQEKNIAVKINKGDATVSIPTQLLGDDQDVTVAVDKLEPVDGALSATYDFTIKTASGTISQFSEPVTLTFQVDPKKVTNPDNVKVWYYNTSTKKWELIGGTYSNGVVTAQTHHFSTYTVFEKNDKPSSSSNETSADSGNGTENELPETATNTMNFLGFGALLILLAVTLLWFQRRKQKA